MFQLSTVNGIDKAVRIIQFQLTKILHGGKRSTSNTYQIMMVVSGKDS